MPELHRHDFTLFKASSGSDERRIPADSVVINIYREGATVSSAASIADGAGGTVAVYDPGTIVTGDTIQDGTDSSVTRTVASITTTSVVLNVGAGAMTFSQYDRLVVTNNRPLTWRTDRSETGYPQTTVTSQVTTDSLGEATCYTAEPVIDAIANDSDTLTLWSDRAGSGGRDDYTPFAWGARSDGATDDAGAFQDAAEYLKAKLSGVYTIPPGNYILASTITFNALLSLKIQGAGKGITNVIINHSDVGFDLTGACTDVEISGMTLTRISGTAADIQIGTSCVRTHIADVRFSNGGIGILDQGSDTKTERVDFGGGNWVSLIHLLGARRPHIYSPVARYTGSLTTAGIFIDTDTVSPRIIFADIAPTTLASDNGIGLLVSQVGAGSDAPADVLVMASRFSGGTGATGDTAVEIIAVAGYEAHGVHCVDSLNGYQIVTGTAIGIFGGSNVGIHRHGIDILGGTHIRIVEHLSSNVNIGNSSYDHVSIAAGVDDVAINGLQVGRMVRGTGTPQAGYAVNIAAGVSDRVQIMGLRGTRTDLATGWVFNGSSSRDVDISHNIEYLATVGLTYGHIRNNILTHTTAATTIDVKNIERIYLQPSAPTTYTDFTLAADGQMLILIAGNTDITIADGGNFSLAGAVSWTPDANDTLTLIFSDVLGFWLELARSDN